MSDQVRCGRVAQMTPSGAADAQWWRDAVIYQIYVRSFADADGDGVGDLPGVRSRLPYVRDLGVDAIWLNPFYPSPQADAGYDVTDYRDVDPALGTLDDVDALVRDAHEAGLRVIVDLVPNHTSSEHAWFPAALAAAPEVASVPATSSGTDAAAAIRRPTTGAARSEVEPGPGSPRLTAPRPVVPAPLPPGSPIWTGRTTRCGRSSSRSCASGSTAGSTAFASTWPTASPRTRRCRTCRKVRGLGAGAGGPPALGPGRGPRGLPCRRITDSYPGDRTFVAEAWVQSPERLALYLRPDELHTAFNFAFLLAPWDADGMRTAIDDSMAALAGVGAPATWVLSNHDVVRHVTRYGGGELGAPGPAAALLMFALPGEPMSTRGGARPARGHRSSRCGPEDRTFLRTGGAEPGRDGCRVPMPWSGREPSFGWALRYVVAPQPGVGGSHGGGAGRTFLDADALPQRPVAAADAAGAGRRPVGLGRGRPGPARLPPRAGVRVRGEPRRQAGPGGRWAAP